jgi:hypothetical protein
MKNLIIIFFSVLVYILPAQTITDDLQLLLELEGVEEVELVEYLKSKIDTDFLVYTLQIRSNSRRLLIEYIASYLDATVVFDPLGRDRLIPKGYSLYDCDVYSLEYKLNFAVPALNDKQAYIIAEEVFKRVHPVEVIKVHIQVINTKLVTP